MDLFGMQYLGNIFDNIDETNRYYGGLQLEASKIALPNGSIDPWHALSITNTTGTDADVIYIEGKYVHILNNFNLYSCLEKEGHPEIRIRFV